MQKEYKDSTLLTRKAIRLLSWKWKKERIRGSRRYINILKSNSYNINPMFICCKMRLICSCLWYSAILWTTKVHKKLVTVLFKLCIYMFGFSFTSQSLFLLSVLTLQECLCPFCILPCLLLQKDFGLGNHTFQVNKSSILYVIYKCLMDNSELFKT